MYFIIVNNYFYSEHIVRKLSFLHFNDLVVKFKFKTDSDIYTVFLHDYAMFAFLYLLLSFILLLCILR